MSAARQRRRCPLCQHRPLRADRLPSAARLARARAPRGGLDQVAREGGGPLLGVREGGVKWNFSYGVEY